MDLPYVSNVTALEAYTGSATQVYVAGFASEGDGGHKIVRWVSGDHTDQITADPDGGFFIAKSTDSTGLTGAWVVDLEENAIPSRLWAPKGGRGSLPSYTNVTPVYEAMKAAAQYVIDEGPYNSVYLDWQPPASGAYNFATRPSPLTKGIMMRSTGGLYVTFKRDFDLPARKYAGDGIEDEFTFPMGSNDDLNSSDTRVLVIEEDANGLIQLVTKQAGTDFTVSQTATETTVTFTSGNIPVSPPTGYTENIYVYDGLNHGFWNIEDEVTEFVGNVQIDSHADNGKTGLDLVEYSNGAAINLLATNSIDSGDSTVIECEISGFNLWTFGVFLDGGDRIPGNNGSGSQIRTRGIRDFKIKDAQVFQCEWASYFLRGVTGLEIGHIKSNSNVVHWDIYITGVSNADQLQASTTDNVIGFVEGTHDHIAIFDCINANLVCNSVQNIDIGSTCTNVNVQVCGRPVSVNNYGVNSTVNANFKTYLNNTAYELDTTDSDGIVQLSFRREDDEKGHIGLDSTSNDSMYYVSEDNNYIISAAGSKNYLYSGASNNPLVADASSFYPGASGSHSLGQNAIPFSNVYTVNAVTVTSDRREKSDILKFSDMSDTEFSKYKRFVNELEMVSFQWIGKSTKQFGFIAQDIEIALRKSGLNPENIGFLVKSKVPGKLDQGKPYYKYGLRLEELLVVINAIKNAEFEHRLKALEATA